MNVISYPKTHLVASSFSHSANSYNKAAILQNAVGDKLLSLAPAQGVCLDLGCGTGRYTQKLLSNTEVSQCFALDIAEGMLAFTQQQSPQAKCLQADAQAIPLPDNSVDFVFSSLMLQWLGANEQVFKEIKRVLKPGGVCVFSSLLEGTLFEMKNAWAQVDDLHHVNEFEPEQAWQHAAESAGFIAQNWQCQPFVRSFDSVRDALIELKALGAHNVNSNRPKAMTGKQKFAAFTQAYETYRSDGQIPASYQVLYGVLRG